MAIRKRISDDGEFTQVAGPTDPRDRVSVGDDPFPKSTFATVFGLPDGTAAKNFTRRLQWNGGEATMLPAQMFASDLLTLVQQPDSGMLMEKRYRERIKSPLTAIRAYCVLCQDGPKGANNCPQVECPLWPFRNGANSFYKRRS